MFSKKKLCVEVLTKKTVGKNITRNTYEMYEIRAAAKRDGIATMVFFKLHLFAIKILIIRKENS
jgi:hypothetical protein